MSFETILPFLRPIESFIKDPAVSEIMVNHGGQVFIEVEGVLRAVDICVPEKLLQIAVRHIARALGDDIDERKPILDSRLPDGSRVSAVVPPCSPDGTTLTIRKFQNRFFSPEELIRTEAMPFEVARELNQAISDGANILISGGTGTGKTTLLNALGSWINEDQRIVLIEDTSEIALHHDNLVRFEARRAQPPDLPSVTIRDLLRAALRHRPDRILLGEVRGGEAFDLLQVLNTGHSGVISTIHANSAELAIARFTTCCLMAGVELPYQAIRSNIAESLSMLVHVERRAGKRLITDVLDIQRYISATDSFEFTPIYERAANAL